jgi:rRNA biogenesis protein RRP5
MGFIKEINDLDMSISLPNQLTGFVSITEITSKITQRVEEVAALESYSDNVENQVNP